MFRAFTNRKPWAAALLALLFGPLAGMLYLNRGRLALGYIVLSILSMVLFIEIYAYRLTDMKIVDGLNYSLVLFQIIGALHCFIVAKRWTGSERLPWYAGKYALISIILVPVLLAWTFRSFGFEPFNVPSGSMTPTLKYGDYFFARKIPYAATKPERGDVVVFRKEKMSFVKRIIGLPGDKVQLKEGIVYVNDVALPRKEAGTLNYKDSSGERTARLFLETLPNGRFYTTLDEYATGPLDNTGFFTVPENEYFMLGDNRDNSTDSRSDKIGTISLEDITGKARVVVWNDELREFMFLPLQ